MSQYFDKNFFKFLLGFVAILGVSFIIVAVMRLYEANESQTGSPMTITP